MSSNGVKAAIEHAQEITAVHNDREKAKAVFDE